MGRGYPRGRSWVAHEFIYSFYSSDSSAEIRSLMLSSLRRRGIRRVKGAQIGRNGDSGVGSGNFAAVGREDV